MYSIPVSTGGTGGHIRFDDLRAFAAAAGRSDLVARMDDFASRRSRYSGEPGDIMGACWASLRWPLEIIRPDVARTAEDALKFAREDYCIPADDEEEVAVSEPMDMDALRYRKACTCHRRKLRRRRDDA